jgi:formylglycine-generating enzyme required for sulfatase activity
MKMKNYLAGAAFLLLFISALAVRAQELIRTDTIPGSNVIFRLSLLPAGTFQMGKAPWQKTVHLDSFWMGVHEVSYDEFIVFYQKEYDTDQSSHPASNYSADAVTRPTPQYIDYTYGMGKSGFPAVSMTQQSALRYCKWLYDKTGVFYRLPTEAEWEYACRAGQADAAWLLAGGKPDDHAWYYDNSFEKYHEKGLKLPNAWGIYDMSGNVAEWTLDYYEEQYLEKIGEEPVANPWIQPLRKHSRTVRGGSYDSPAEACACTARQKSDPRWQARDPQIPKSRWWNPDSPFVGFRIVSPVEQPAAAAVAEFFAKAIKD